MTEIFGVILVIRGRPGTVIFVILLAFLMMLEYMFGYLQTLSNRHGYNDIYDKLKKELMLLGIISFTVFIYESSVDASANSWLEAFEMAHIIVLFMAISFIIQALMLVRYASVGGKQLITAIRKTFGELKAKYIELDNKKDSLAYKAFHYLPSWLPIYPSFRFDIEYRIIEKYFLERHPLPKGFRFSKYATILFKKYISELGDVAPVSWLLLAFFVVLNYIRIVAVDKYLKSSYCSSIHTEESSSSEDHHRYLSSTTKKSDLHTFEESLKTGCLDYAMSYSALCGWILLFFVVVVFFLCNFYYDKLIRYCLKKEQIEKQGGRHMFETFLDRAQQEENKYRAMNQLSPIERDENRDVFGLGESEVSRDGGELGQSKETFLQQIGGIISPRAFGYHKSQRQIMSHKNKHKSFNLLGELYATDESLTSINQYKAEMEHIKSKLEHDSEVEMNKPLLEKVYSAVKSINEAIFDTEADDSEESTPHRSLGDSGRLFETYPTDDIESFMVEPMLEHYKDSKPISRIFLFKSPELHFKIVEIGLLLQCFYISVWATQLIPLAVHSSRKEEFIVLLTLPIVLTTILFTSIIHRSVMLHTIVALNSQVVDIVCDQSIDEINIVSSIRRCIQERLVQKKIEQSKWRAYIHQQLEEFDLNGDGTMDAAEFRNFLGTLNIFMSKQRFDILWEAVDYDMSGAITWDELYILAFPEYLFDIKEEMRLFALLKSQLQAKLFAEKIPKSNWIRYLYTTFRSIDVNGDDFIDDQEFCSFLEDFGIKELSAKEMKMLYMAIDINGSGGITFSEFLRILHLKLDYEGDTSVKKGDSFDMLTPSLKQQLPYLLPSNINVDPSLEELDSLPVVVGVDGDEMKTVH
jgi:Ca2+-binding EF-hand superfamily protein